jgi:membrane protein DedA with SNARE-associated domain
MTHAAQFALAHGAALLFTWILLQQAGVPIPSAPLLIAVGSLASYGRGSLTRSGSYIALGYLLHGQLHWTLARTLRPLFIVRVAVSLARLRRRRSLAHACWHWQSSSLQYDL